MTRTTSRWFGRFLAAGVATLIVQSATHASPLDFSFTPLGDLPGGVFSSQAWAVSADGSVVVGSSTSASGNEAFRWTSSSGMVGLGDFPGARFDSQARGASEEGSVVIGYGTPTTNTEAFRWTSGTGMVGLGDLPGGVVSSAARAISADGSTVVGDSTSASGNEAFRWTSGGGMVGLGDLPGGIFNSHAFNVSADGSVIVGESESASGTQAFLWTSSGGMIGLGDLPGGIFNSHATAVSADGSVVVGFGYSASGREAFRWDSSGGMVGLGELPGGTYLSMAKGVAADGLVVIGTSDTAAGLEAFLWNSSLGMVRLQDYLAGNGVAGLTGWKLNEGMSISADGRTLVGIGINPLGQTEAWMATVPEPSSSVLAVLGCLGLFAVSRAGRRRIAGVGLTLTAGMLLAAMPCNSDAAPVTYQFTGHVTYTSFPSTVGIAAGDAFSGTFTYELVGAADSDPSASLGQYKQISAVANVAASIHGLPFVGAPVGPNTVVAVQILDNYFGTDSFREYNESAHMVLPTGWSHIGFERLWIDLTDSSQSAYSDDHLPAALSLSSFNNPTLNWRAEEGTVFTPSGSYLTPSITGRIEALTLVPEPATGLLAMMGLASCLAMCTVSARRRVKAFTGITRQRNRMRSKTFLFGPVKTNGTRPPIISRSGKAAMWTTIGSIPRAVIACPRPPRPTL